MKVSNFVISTVVAISAAGGLGFAYAQSSYSEPQPATSAPTTQTQDVTPTRQDATPETMEQSPSSTMGQDSRTMGQDSTGSTGTSRSGSTYNERVARADRN